MMSTRTSLAQRPRQPVLMTSQRLPTTALTPFSSMTFMNAASTSLAPIETPPVPWQIRIFIVSLSLIRNHPLPESMELIYLHRPLVVVGNDRFHLLNCHRTVGGIIDHGQRRHAAGAKACNLFKGVAEVRRGFCVAYMKLVEEGLNNPARPLDMAGRPDADPDDEASPRLHMKLGIKCKNPEDLARIDIQPLRHQVYGRLRHIAVFFLNPLENRHQVAMKGQIFIYD